MIESYQLINRVVENEEMNEENEEQTNIEEEEPNSNQKYFAIILIILCFRAKRVIDPSKTTVDYLTNNITCRLYF